MEEGNTKKGNKFLVYREFQVFVNRGFDCLFRAFIISCFRDEKMF